SAALNWIYTPSGRSEHIDYALLYPTNRLGKSLPALEPNLPIHYDFLAGVFDGNTSRAIAFYFSPPACLHVLDPELDGNNHLILDDSLMREAAALSAPELIVDQPIARMPEIYSPEPVHGWCYYFETADLARQVGDWPRVSDLGDIAFALGDYPNDPTERFVFIEGYAHMGEWDKALGYSQVSYDVSKNLVRPLLCKLWDRIERELPDSAERDRAVGEARSSLSCPPR
ncbi:MAG TPA: hypothetical protein VGJ22_10580, partial [Anaerolineales bacterium]